MGRWSGRRQDRRWRWCPRSGPTQRTLPALAPAPRRLRWASGRAAEVPPGAAFVNRRESWAHVGQTACEPSLGRSGPGPPRAPQGPLPPTLLGPQTGCYSSSGSQASACHALRDPRAEPAVWFQQAAGLARAFPRLTCTSPISSFTPSRPPSLHTRARLPGWSLRRSSPSRP